MSLRSVVFDSIVCEKNLLIKTYIPSICIPRKAFSSNINRIRIDNLRILHSTLHALHSYLVPFLVNHPDVHSHESGRAMDT